MEARGGVRSSARLSGEAARSGGSGSSGNGRPAEVAAAAAAAAALRRQRAAERAKEVEDSPRVLREKCRRLARALRNAKHLVVYTGAGISTAADIPDYRGPHGVWTRLQRGETVGRVEVSRAQPTFTHMALTALWARGALKFVVSQNCDGLHLRAGLPRRALAELHGDMFAELCAACRRVYLRAFDTTERTARHAHGTRRLCHACGAELRDSIVHFGERGRAAWPLNWAGALRHAARADVVLCLGSSLKVLRRYPRLWRMQAAPRSRPALYIVNLQWTPKDAVAALKINARCDDVMRQVARRLRLRVPRYTPARDPLLAHAEPLAASEAHTTRRPLLGLKCPPADSDTSASDFSSPSASDSDEELPLRRLAERLRGPEELPLRRLAERLRGPEEPQLRRPAERARGPEVSPLRCPTERFRGPEEVPLQCPAERVRDPEESPLRCPAERVTGPEESPLRCPASRLSVPEPAAACPPPPPPPPRAPEPPPPPPHPPSPRTQPPDLLRAFQVSMRSGHATILLKAEHAPVRPLPPLAPAPPPRPPAPASLRSFRMIRPRPAFNPAPVRPPELIKIEKEEMNGDPAPPNGLNSRLRRLLECEPRLGADEKPKIEPKAETKKEEESSSSEEGNGAGALAAAYFARAVLVCRASLYPGLHTIIAPPPTSPVPPQPRAECAWCLRRYSARRCLWYGPPRVPPLDSRVWRRVRGRRVLCACCTDTNATPGPIEDGGGWYGKGYRKGRRRR